MNTVETVVFSLFYKTNFSKYAWAFQTGCTTKIVLDNYQKDVLLPLPLRNRFYHFFSFNENGLSNNSVGKLLFLTQQTV